MATESQHGASDFRWQVLQRFFLIFLPAAALLAGAVAVVYRQDRAAETEIHFQAGRHLVDVHAEIIGREWKSVESDLRYLSESPLLREFVSGRAEVRQALAAEYARFCCDRAIYDQIRYLDAEGREAIRINYNSGRPEAVAAEQLQSKRARYYFAAAWQLDRRGVFVSDFDLNVEHDRIEQPPKPVVRFATPVFDDRGVKRGVLVLNYLGAKMIQELSHVAEGYPGSAWLLDRSGGYIRGPRREDEWGTVLESGRGFVRDFPGVYARLVSAGRGQFLVDEGLFTAQEVTVPVGSGDWGRGGDRAGEALFKASDNDGREAALLRVVSYIPRAVLWGSSRVLLRRMLLVLAAACLLLAVLAWYLARAAWIRREHERQLELSEARLRVLASRLLTAQEDERRSVARDLHDELGQLGTAVTLEVEAAARAAGEGPGGSQLARALLSTRSLLEKIHEIAGRLRPTLLDDLGLRSAVEDLLAEFSERYGMSTRADLRFTHNSLPRMIGENIYRIMQEALTNAARHSGAAEVWVDLEVGAARVALTVRDSGRGFEPAALSGQRLGLIGMRERVELLGGDFTIESAPGEGTLVRAEIPLAAPAATGGV